MTETFKLMSPFSSKLQNEQISFLLNDHFYFFNFAYFFTSTDIAFFFILLFSIFKQNLNKDTKN